MEDVDFFLEYGRINNKEYRDNMLSKIKNGSLSDNNVIVKYKGVIVDDDVWKIIYNDMIVRLNEMITRINSSDNINGMFVSFTIEEI